jgi:hypothetical protein
MNFNLFPNDTSLFESEFTTDQVVKLLKENSFEGSISSTAHSTDKRFIGTLSNHRFRIISSQPKNAMLCVFEGKIEEASPTKISINSKFHTSFKWLFILWILGLIAVIFICPKAIEEQIKEAIVFLIIAFVIKHFIVKILFKTNEQKGLEELKNILHLTKIE